MSPRLPFATAPFLPIRLMVGLWFLVPAIGVRVPDRQQTTGPNVYTFGPLSLLADQGLERLFRGPL